MPSSGSDVPDHPHKFDSGDMYGHSGHGGMIPDGTEPLVDPRISMRDVTNDVTRPMFQWPPLTWHVAFGIAQLCAAVGALVVITQIRRGMGISGINNPVGWGVYITNFVFWIGIGHAGTLISAILFLFRQKWRTAINRSAEAMTIFAVMVAGLFPLLHTGRPWKAYWLIPYVNDRLLWVNFRSPLVWDVFAVTTYATISIVFWYVGLIPDLATARDRARNKIQKFFYGTLAVNWTGSVRDWAHYERAYAQFAWIATPLVLSVHSVVSFDFAASLIPGWHTTIFPPYFVAGAIFSGFGMVITLLVVLRWALQLEHLITVNHLELCNKIILATSMLVLYAYISEFFVAWYSEAQYEQAQFNYRLFGDHWWATWIMLTCNGIIPQLFWFRKIRRHLLIMWIISLFVNVGMWFERVNIFVQSLEHDFLPVNWHYFVPSIFDAGITLASFGMFFTLFLLFSRVLPTMAMAELKSVLHNHNARGVQRKFEIVTWPAKIGRKGARQISSEEASH
jgi:molybdopterin-containing oxidoreductase family membrane subunit